jgi:hypothetical protein
VQYIEVLGKVRGSIFIVWFPLLTGVTVIVLQEHSEYNANQNSAGVNRTQLAWFVTNYVTRGG